MKRKATIKIYKLVIFGVVFLFAAIIAKLCYVSLSENVDGINLTKFANGRNTVKKTLYANRGSILDVNGNDLATTVNSYKLIAYLEKSRTTNPDDPQHVVDKGMTAKKLADVLEAPEDKMVAIIKEVRTLVRNQVNPKAVATFLNTCLRITSISNKFLFYVDEVEEIKLDESDATEENLDVALWMNGILDRMFTK